MNWIYGLLFAVLILLPMFVLVCRADKPVDKEGDKVLMGAMD